MNPLTYYPPTHWRPDKAGAINSLNCAIKEGRYQLEEVRCANCRSRRQKRLFSRDRYGIHWSTVACRRCGLVYSSPRFTPASHFAFYASDEYWRIYGGTEEIQGRYSRDEWPYVDLLGEHLKSIESVLEVGAGGGWNLYPLMMAGARCVGYDYSPSMVRMGRKRGLDMRCGGDGEVEGAYDLIMLVHALEHWLDPIGQLCRLRERLNEGGLLLVEVPGADERIPSVQNAHNYYFSFETLYSVVRQAGLEVERWHEVERNGYIRLLLKRGLCRTPIIEPGEFPRVKAMARDARLKHAKYFVRRLLGKG